MISFLVEAIGWLGAFLILAAYWFISTNRSNAQDPKYQSLNAVGSAALIVNAFVHQAWPLLALDVIWCLIALVSIIKMFGKKSLPAS